MRDPFQELDQHGYTLLGNVLQPSTLTALRQRLGQLFVQEGELAGAEFKQEAGAQRLANLLNKGVIFQCIVDHPRILKLVRHVLQGSVKLSSVNARSANPNGREPQPLHCDMAAIPDTHGSWVCNVVWMIDDFTAENGALRVVPGSHRSHRLPQNALQDPTSPHPDELILTGRAGSVIVMNAHLWHGGLANRSNHSRTAIHSFYCRRDKPQQQYQKALLDRDLQRSLSAEMRYLLALDDPLNDALASRNVARSGFLR